MNPIQIPIIDISPLNLLDTAKYDHQIMAPVLSEIHESLSDIGFIYIKGHGISQNLIDEIYEISKEFFKFSEVEKMNYSMSKNAHQWRGYFPKRGLPIREGIFFWREHPDDHPGVVEKWMMHGKNQFPNERFQVAISQYIDQLTQVAQRLMKAMALSLGLESDYFEKRGFTLDSTVSLRIFNYPQQIKISVEWEVKEHTDYGFMTLLNQDVSPGLQIKLKTGEWIQAAPIQGTLISILETCSNYGLMVSTRPLLTELSLSFLFDPSWKSTLEPIDVKLLRKVDLDSVTLDNRYKRWEGVDLKHLADNWTFGEQMLIEVQK